MIFGKAINRYYLRYGPILLLGMLALVIVDYFQLRIPELYKLLINCINTGMSDAGEVFDMNFLLDNICRPVIFIILRW